jgi:hypothetical protein
VETKNESCCRDALKHMGRSVCVEMRELKCTEIYCCVFIVSWYSMKLQSHLNIHAHAGFECAGEFEIS